MFFCILGINWAMLTSTMDLLDHWTNVGKRNGEEEWWKIIPACIWWIVWEERNSRHFENTSNLIQEIR